MLQSFFSSLLSQEIRGAFQITTENNITNFKDVNSGKFRGYPKDKDGKILYDLNSSFSSKEKLKKIESDIYTKEEREYMLEHYKPLALAIASAVDGKIVSINFRFFNLHGPSVIDIAKLKRMRSRIMAEIWLEDISFTGGDAASGYLATVSMRFFR